jgi:hypothetical protein
MTSAELERAIFITMFLLLQKNTDTKIYEV